MAEISKPDFIMPKPIPSPGLFPIPRGGGSAAIIRFESAYMLEQAKTSEDARVLVEEAIDLLRKASNHNRWRCRERFQIDDGLHNAERQMKKAAGELTGISSALQKGAEQFAALEDRAASQESELNAELRKTWAFETDVWDPNPPDNPVDPIPVPEPPIPIIPPPGMPGPDPTKPGPDPGPDPTKPGPDPDPDPTKPTPDPEPGPDPKPDPTKPKPDPEPDPDPKPKPKPKFPPGWGKGRPGKRPVQPVPPPRVIRPIIIYVPYPAGAQSAVTAPVVAGDVLGGSGSAQSGGGYAVLYGDAANHVSVPAGGASGSYTPSASTTAPLTFSYSDSQNGAYGGSSFGGSGFFSGGGSGSGNDSLNSLMSMLLAWLTQIFSGSSNSS
jgi:hypothetical protein